MISLKFILLVFIIILTNINNAFAYIDPGTGSIIVQMIIGGLVGVGIAIKVFWYRIKTALSPGFKKNNSDDEI